MIRWNVIGEKSSEDGALRVVLYKGNLKGAFSVQAFAGRDKITEFSNIFDAMDYANAHLNGVYTVDGEWA